MDLRRPIFLQTAAVALGQALCTGVMVSIFALSGRYDLTVLLGGFAGGVLATGNFFLMSLLADMAADRAENQDVAGGQKLIRLSYLVRMTLLLIVLVACGKTGWFRPLALALPLIFTRPILTVIGLFPRKGGGPIWL